MKKKTSYTLLALAILLLNAATQPMNAQNYAWAARMGSTSDDTGNKVIVDGSGNVYTTGDFTGTVDFDPSAGTSNLTSAGVSDVFITKFDAAGNLIWAKNMGGTSFDRGYDIAVDGSGNVYTTGWFSGTADFDPNAGTANLTSVGSTDIFISKLDASGNYVWAKSIGGSIDDYGFGLALDGSGNVYVTGTFQNTADFDPNAGTTSLTSAGLDDIFVMKLDDAGNLIWAKKMGGSSDDVAWEVAIDGSGNVYTTGYFNSIADFDPNAGTAALSSAGGWDVFVSKLDASGTYVWAKRIGGVISDNCNEIAIDGSGNVCLVGWFQGTVDFDPNAGTTNLTSAGDGDIFVLKLSAAGNLVWVKTMGASGRDYGNGIAIDGSNNVYTTGRFQSTVDFDPNAGTTNLTSTGLDDIFVSKLDESGNLVWAKRLGGTGIDNGYAIAADGSGNVYATGVFTSTVDFDPSNCSANLTSAGNNDVFLIKLRETAGANINTWLGNSTDWTSAINWTCGVPTTTDPLTIPATANNPILLSNQTVGDLTFSGANHIQLGDFNLTVNSISGSSTAYVVTNGLGSLIINNISTTATLFPIGPSTTVYAPATITNNVNRNFSVRVGTTVILPVANYKYVNLQWEITPSVSTGNSATLALGWSSGSQAVGFNPASAVQINHFNTSTVSWDISTSATVSGSDPYTATASGITSFSPFSVSNVVVLPVELVNFSGKNTEGGNLLTWETANEVNNKGFEVERRQATGDNWEILGFVVAKGKSATYTFMDNLLTSARFETSPTLNYYRLKQIDNDGKETYSKVIALSNSRTNQVTIYPSVTRHLLSVETNDIAPYQIFNLLGQPVLTGKTGQQIDVSTLPQGTYILRVGQEQAKFMKQ
ncbi:MAG: SBBP repeat-containing protein [Saprospiraceae bacterium]|nr:SBBP repeat-containing protein [Saprospiraceae bacterium]